MENIWRDFEEIFRIGPELCMENSLDGILDLIIYIVQQIMPLIYTKAFELQWTINEIGANNILVVSFLQPTR